MYYSNKSSICYNVLCFALQCVFACAAMQLLSRFGFNFSKMICEFSKRK